MQELPSTVCVAEADEQPGRQVEALLMRCCVLVRFADNLIHATYMGPTGEQD